MNKKPNNFFLILILGSMTALSPFSIDMYLPAFPQIAKDFGTTVSTIALSISSYFVGLSFGQLIYGPLLDRFGRKKPLYIGLLIYAAASFGCLLTDSSNSLIGFRFFQALGGCAAGVAAMSIVRDLFSVKESSKILSLLILVLGVSPLIAPTAGSYMTLAFGWHSIFIVLALISLLILGVVFFFLPESHTPDSEVTLKLSPIFKTYKAIFKEPQFYTHVLAGAFAFSGLFVYVASSPMIFMSIYKVSPQVYGWIFAGLSVGFIGFSQLNIFLLHKFQNDQILRGALILQTTSALVFLVGTFSGWYGIVGTIFHIFSLLACAGLTNPNAASLALAPFTKNTGSAAALMGFLQMGIGALVSSCVGFLSSDDMIPLTVIFATSSTVALLIFVIGRRRITKYFAPPDIAH
ncbi:MAG: multidrug effflux MFS transporter [Bdellovibrionota bacterium]